MSTGRYIAFAAASLAALGACAQTDEQIGYSRGEHRVLTAAEVTAELRIEPFDAAQRLDEGGRSAVRGFAAAYQAEGHGAIVISRPESHERETAALRMANDARALMIAEGVDPAHIAEGPYNAYGSVSAPLVISYRTWEAVAPNCPDVSQLDMVWTGTNSSLPSLGCAVTANLAAMIADPSDLVGAQPMDPADSGRRSIVMSKYRNGEVTASARAPGASGAISSAVGN